jgi:S-adenosylmethionine:tRNA ribosyltransferase-isomerase
MTLDPINKSEFDFDLPDSRIAKYPLQERSQSKLLVFQNQEIQMDTFRNISEYMNKDSLVVMNNAKVIPARLYFKRESGAAIEILLLEPILPASYEEAFNAKKTTRWKCIIGNSKKWKDSETIYFAEHPELISAKLIDRDLRIVELQWQTGESFTAMLDKIGELPLPPYLNRSADESDYETYQTIFAKNAGSVAAPTAGLHFTDDVFESTNQKGILKQEVTLHVGAGTFLPVKEENVLNHDMHREHFEVTKESIDALLQKDQVIAVGTTTLRVLESLYWLGIQLKEGKEDFLVKKLEPYEKKAEITYKEALVYIKLYLESKKLAKFQAATEIMILPTYKLRSIYALITNFHLPKSTLLMLISSVVGEEWKKIYQTALENDFRFLSYGDSSLLFVE